MQSDQKIGLSLLIALTGFGLALGFGRRESPAEVVVAGAELASAADVLTPVDDPAPAVPAQTPAPMSPRIAPTAVADIPVAEPPASTPDASPAIELPPPPVRRRVEPVAEAELLPADPPPAPTRTYVIQPGDTLSGIAARELGDSRRYADIYEANREALGHPDAIRVGQTLVLPAR